MVHKTNHLENKMKKYLLLTFVTLIILLSSCSQKNNKLTIEYNKSLVKSDPNKVIVQINIDSISDFKMFQERIQSAVCAKEIPVILFQINDTIKKIYTTEFCWDYLDNISYKARNNIDILDDVIRKDEKIYSLDSLCNLMKKDFLNYGKNPNFSDHPENLIVNISYTSKEFNNLKFLLNRITNCYDNLGMKTQLNFNFIEVIFPKLKPNI